MAWTSTLAADLAAKTLPLVLAGPILRRVTPNSVTVWVALRESRNVTLIVTDAFGADSNATDHIQAQASRDTVQIGTYLHIVAVVARTPAGKPLTPGPIYFYDLVFDDHKAAPVHLSPAVGKNELGNPVAYAPYDLPSFALPPKDLNALRLMHGSCRKPHGWGSDALGILDGLIQQGLQNGDLRPHQLLLTGDQIYADDVADVLLMALSDAGETLLGWNEALPVPAFGSSTQTSSVADWPPEFRQCPLLVAGFTSDDLRSHLMSLGEFLAMYLFAWSDVLWPKVMPSYDDLKAAAQPILPRLKMNTFTNLTYDNYLKGPMSYGLPAHLQALGISFKDLSHTAYDRYVTFTGKMSPYHPGGGGIFSAADDKDLVKTKSDIGDDANDVNQYRSAISRVRRALANIPTYMICDDHEITDDWNMTRNFCAGVYGSPLGRHVVQNGLAAYSLCQAWGNTPEQFEDSDPAPAGLSLLQRMDKGTSDSYFANSSDLQGLVGIHDDKILQTRPDNAVYHDQSSSVNVHGVTVSQDSIIYNYSIQCTSHQVIVTDTRTWRSFPRGGDEPPELIPKNQMAAQLGGPVVPAEQVLLVVLTTNAPPIQPIRTAARHPDMVGIYYADLWDSWEMGSVALDRMLARLTDRLPTDAKTNALTGAIVLLSGDVHHGFASRLFFQGKARFEDVQPTAVSAVFAQLVCSAFKNQGKLTLGLHDGGYKYAPHGGFLIPAHVPEFYVGYNVTPGKSFAATPADFEPYSIMSSKPTIELDPEGPEGPAGPNVYKLKPPDYRYRLEYLKTAAQGEANPLPPSLPAPGASPSADDRQKALQQFNQASGYYRTYNRSAGKPREIVGRNNLGEVTFNWGAGNARAVNHTLRWWNVDTAKLVWSTYTVSLDATSPAALKAPNEA